MQKNNSPTASPPNSARLITGFALAILLMQRAASGAELPVDLGSAAGFGVLAGTTITSVGATVINGDLGLWPGSAVTGFPPGIVTGTMHVTDPIAQAAQGDLTTAFTDAAGRSTAPSTVAGDIGGTTKPPGLYKSTSSLGILAGDLTLDAGGDPNAVWIFQVATTLTTWAGSLPIHGRVILAGGAQAANVFWQVGDSATIGDYFEMKGNILALNSITMDTGSLLEGRALARNAAVTYAGGGGGTVPVLTNSVGATDLAVFKTGPTNVFAGTNFDYSITVTNLGPFTVTNLVVKDFLPTNLTFVSASGGGNFNGSQVIWTNLGNLAANASTNLTLTVTPSASPGNVTNFATVSSSSADSNLANNNSVFVVNNFAPGVDVAVFKTGPTNAFAGTNFSYSIAVRNLGSSTATNVVVKDYLPAGTVFVSASPAGVLNNSVLTWPTVPTLASGATTNYTITLVTTNLVTITNTATVTNDVSDSNLTNNTSRSATAVVQWGLTFGPQSSNLSGGPVYNPQTGLYQETVFITNSLPGATVTGLRLFVVGLRSGVNLQNAFGTNAGQPYVQYNPPLPPGGHIQFLLEFLSLDRRSFTNSFRIETNAPAYNNRTNGTAIQLDGSRLHLNETYVNGSVTINNVFIEFATISGRSYTVMYSDNLAGAWKAAMPSVKASATVYQWIDAGPPKTETPPPGEARFYKVLLLP